MGRKLSDSVFVKMYLILYNFAQCAGWGLALYEVVMHFKSGNRANYPRLWEKASLPITIFQTLQLIEVVHAAIKFVPSNPVTTFIQIISRIIVVWAIVVPIKETRSSIGIPLILTAWSIAEMTRYLYYALNLISSRAPYLMPYLLTWCRYSFFMILYPIGVSGELILMYTALPYIRRRQLLYFKMPNPYNVSFYSDWLLIAIMLSYIPFFPQLFLYMISQRNKVLGGGGKSKTKKIK